MQEHAGNDKSCVACDGLFGRELKEEMFAIRFGSPENCKFKEMVEEITESLGKIGNKESEKASSAAGLIEKWRVAENKNETNNKKEVALVRCENKEKDNKVKEVEAEESSSTSLPSG